MFFCFFCELLLHFLSTSVMFDSNSLAFLLPVCFTQLPFCIYLLPLFLKKFNFLPAFSTSVIFYVLLHPRSPNSNSLVFSYIAVHSTSQGIHVALPEDFLKSYTNGVISMWNPFTSAFPLASQSYSLNVKVVIYVPPFVSIFSTLLHGCCCFY